MARLPVLSGADLVRILRKIGYVWDHTEGSHMILVHPTRARLSVPRQRELGRGLLRAIIGDAGLTREEFVQLVQDS
ncbi:MAG: type II toxin-antitoxin system HicA family toxin [Chloroflexi bacterium]|nr:type II toxin-antitoxin system HicA family toxin [Chloroflexota bacterium]